MGKKVGLFVLIVVFVVALMALTLFLFLSPFRHLGGDTDYREARKTIVSQFEKNRDAFDDVAEQAIRQGSADGLSVKRVDTVHLTERNGHTVVTFLIGSQGLMTGGQNWGLYYSKEDVPVNLWEDTLLSAQDPHCYYWQSEDQRHFYATEKIADHWYVYYEDYDGNRHGLSWAK